MSNQLKKRIYFGFMIIVTSSVAPLLYRAYLNVEDFMKVARVVRADVTEQTPLSDRMVRFNAGNHVVQIPLQDVVGVKRMRDIGDNIEIAYQLTRPENVRWLTQVNWIRTYFVWLLLLSMIPPVLMAVVFLRTFITTVPPETIPARPPQD